MNVNNWIKQKSTGMLGLIVEIPAGLDSEWAYIWWIGTSRYNYELISVQDLEVVHEGG